jgi:hypothetical protein
MERLTRAKAIRAKCLDCCCGQANEVRNCPMTTCPLWNFRLGKEIGENAPKRPRKQRA